MVGAAERLILQADTRAAAVELEQDNTRLLRGDLPRAGWPQGAGEGNAPRSARHRQRFAERHAERGYDYISYSTPLKELTISWRCRPMGVSELAILTKLGLGLGLGLG